MKYLLKIIPILLISGAAYYGYLYFTGEEKNQNTNAVSEAVSVDNAVIEVEKDIHPLMIEQMRVAEYPGSEIVIEQTLPSGSNYKRYIVSYLSEGNKIYAMLTVPSGNMPEDGWPAIVFNHGYIPPEQYRTTERYVAYVDGFASRGYVVIKSDYRGHGSSEGQPSGAYYSTGYTADVLNAVSSIKKLDYVNPDKIGMWGHSMGGHITIRSMVINKDIKAGVIWAGVVSSYDSMMNNWRRDRPWTPSTRERSTSRPGRAQLIEQYGDSSTNPEFWQSISPIYYVSDVSGPVQIHHGTADAEVPWEFSQELKDALDNAGKVSELFIYNGADHNLSGNAFGQAMSRSVQFFDKYLKD